jgi:ketosteroid isomerase-like protein
VETLLVDGDRAAALIRLTANVRATGKVMSVRTSQFSRYRDGKVIEMRAVLDSYDMVEQVLGRTIDLAPMDLESLQA